MTALLARYWKFSGKERIPAAPHLTCIGSTSDNIRAILEHYQSQGIRRIVALRGDLPSGTYVPGEFRYANELVAFIRAETGSHFHIEVAAYPELHPQSSSVEQDLLNFRRKVEAGANSAITQYFYNCDAYFNFIDSCEKLDIDLPIVPGIMPITNYKQLARFSDTCGAEIPRWIRKRLESFGDDLASLRAFGSGRGDGTVSAPAGTGRAGIAFLYHESGGTDFGYLGSVGVVCVQGLITSPTFSQCVAVTVGHVLCPTYPAIERPQASYWHNPYPMLQEVGVFHRVDRDQITSSTISHSSANTCFSSMP